MKATGGGGGNQLVDSPKNPSKENKKAQIEKLDNELQRLFEQANQARIKAENDLKEANETIQTLQANLTEQDGKIAQLHSETTQLNAEKQQLNTKLDSLTTERNSLKASLDSLTTERNKLKASLDSLNFNIYESYKNLSREQKISVINDTSFINFIASVSNPTNIKKLYDELSERFDGLKSANEPLAHPATLGAYELGLDCLCAISPNYTHLNIKVGESISTLNSTEYFRHRNFSSGSRVKKVWIQGYKTGTNVLAQTLIFTE